MVKDSKEVVVKWLEKYVTARMPDPINEKQLYELVNKCKRHWTKRTKTCQRIIKQRGKIFFFIKL